MKFTQDQLDHVIFLTEVVLDTNKRHLTRDVLQVLLYIVKSLRAEDLGEVPYDEIMAHLSRIERILIAENERLRDIRSQLQHYHDRNPFG